MKLTADTRNDRYMKITRNGTKQPAPIPAASKKGAKKPSKPSKGNPKKGAKPSKKPAAVQATPTLASITAGEWFAATGTKGTALFKGRLNTEGFVIPLETCSGRKADLPPVCKTGKSVIVWKGNSPTSQAGKAVRAWVSQAGQPVTVERLKNAKACHRLSAEVDGKKSTVWVPVGVRSGMKAPQYVGIERPGGRVETKALNAVAAGRADNMAFAGSVVL